MRKNSPVFNDGVVNIYSVINHASPGKKPEEKLVFKIRLRYCRRIIGSSRYYAAKQAGAKVDRLIRCPYLPLVGAEDVAVLEDGAQYQIKRVQTIEDTRPQVMDLTLEMVVKAIKFNRLESALLSVHDNVGHYEQLSALPPYIVWAEDGPGDSCWGDNKIRKQAIEGTIDLYTQTENDPLFENIEKALNAAGIAWKYNSTQYQPAEKLIHHEWVWQLGKI